VIVGRSLASAQDRSSRLLGQVDGLCGWAQDMCVNFFCILNVTLRAQDLGGQQGVVMDIVVRLVCMSLVRVKRFL